MPLYISIDTEGAGSCLFRFILLVAVDTADKTEYSKQLNVLHEDLA